MCPAPAVERRKHPRHTLHTRVQFHHYASQRGFPARCVDISHGGMLMYAPAITPVAAGDSLRVTLAAVDQPELAELGERPLDASVVRVGRDALLTAGHLAVALKFKAESLKLKA